MAKEKVIAEQKEVTAFEEWRVEHKKTEDVEGPFKVVIVKIEKLKKLRDRVVISQEEADIINEGRIVPSCTNPIMYLAVDEDMEKFTRKYYPKTN